MLNGLGIGKAQDVPTHEWGAGHLGHISLNPDGPPDIVGTPGSLEQTIGNATLAERSTGRFTSTRRLVEAHLNGDEKATDVWLRSVYNHASLLHSSSLAGTN